MNIKGKHILLRAIEQTDLLLLQTWANDPEVQYMLGGWHFPTNMNDQQEWFQSISCNSNNQRFIIENDQQEPIGMANLVNINFKDGNAEHGLLLDKAQQSKGYGKDVVFAIMKYAFNELRLNRLETTIIETNLPSLKLFLEKCSWKQEGILRNWYYRNGKFTNKIILGILKNEYLQLSNNGFQ